MRKNKSSQIRSIFNQLIGCSLCLKWASGLEFWDQTLFVSFYINVFHIFFVIKSVLDRFKGVIILFKIASNK